MDRRAFLAGALGVAAATPAMAAVDSAGKPLLRGMVEDGELHIDPHSRTDGSGDLQDLLDRASADNRQLFLPPETFVVSELKLPARTRLAGVPGATRLVFGGGAFMIAAERAEIVELAGLTVDGAGLPVETYIPGIVHLAECADVAIDNCTIVGSSVSGIAIDRSTGRITRTTVSGAADAGIRAIESRGLSIADNTIENCGNGGILVFRWSDGEDGTMVTGNRIGRIKATAGGDGYNGNGISVFRAHGVTIANNRVADCAYTGIRADSANNVQISGNTCRVSGEAGVLVEFAFEGALIANNLIDGATSGIGVINFNEGGRLAVVSGNIVRNITDAGVDARPRAFGTGIVVEADAAVTGNVIEGAPVAGIRIGWGPHVRDVAATGNVIRRAPVGIAVSVIDGAGPVVISDNLISGAERGAVIGMHWADAATGDLTEDGAAGFPHLLVERNFVS